MRNRIVAVAGVGVLTALAWFVQPPARDPVSIAWYVAGWATIVLGCGVWWSGRLNGRPRAQILLLIFTLLLADLCWSRPDFVDLAVIGSVTILVSLLVVFQGRYPVLEYLWLVRFPLALALFLAFLPITFERRFPSFLGNLLVLRAVDLVIVTTMAVIVARATAFSADLIVRFGSKRAGVPPWPGLERVTGFLVRTPVAGLLAVPLVGFVLARCTSNWYWSLPIAAIGFVLAEAVVWMGRFAAALLGPHEPTRSSDAMPTHSEGVLQKAQKTNLTWAAAARKSCHDLMNQQQDWIREGYCDASGMHPGMLTVVGIALATLAVYAIGYFVFFPENQTIPRMWEPPALAYLLILLMLLTWGLSAVSFFLDRFRISAGLVIFAIPFILFFVHDLDHYYALRPVESELVPQSEVKAVAPKAEADEERDIRAAFVARLKNFHAASPSTREPVVVAVAASGGGITAAVWTATVLEGLQEDFGSAFADSIHLISSVSGGSVGTMHYVDGFRHGEHPKASEAVRRASQSSLSAVAWGLAYPDFWRAFSLRHPRRWEIDRGWAMEKAWARQFKDEATLSQWRKDSRAGWRPAVAFNATVVETGERLIMSSLQLNTLPDDCPKVVAGDEVESSACESGLAARTHFSLFGKHDLPVVSAARLSSTFPFVSPIARARASGGLIAYHVADGGYYDNFGVVTLIEWARKLVQLNPRPSEYPSQPRLLIVEIRQSDYRVLGNAPPKTRAGWTYATIGPLSAMMNVRQSSQAMRNDLEIQLLTDWAKGQGWNVSSAVFLLPAASPMSWHLAEAETVRITNQWTACKARRDSTIAKAWSTVERLFPQEGDAAKASAAGQAGSDKCEEPVRSRLSAAR